MENNYYQKHKEQRVATVTCQNSSEDEEEKRWKKATGRYQNLSEEEKKP